MTDAAKRSLDVVASALGLVVLSPVLAGIAVAIRLSDGPPVMFRQERVGLRGRPFTILKFRTMRAGDGAQVTSAGDARITHFGRALRRSKLDELPQLWCVLTGDMSLVGPRPEVARYVAEWPDDARAEILSVRPGITDPASLEFRHEEDELAAAEDPVAWYREVILPRKVELYVDYVRTRSFLNDLALIARTALAVAKKS